MDKRIARARAKVARAEAESGYSRMSWVRWLWWKLRGLVGK